MPLRSLGDPSCRVPGPELLENYRYPERRNYDQNYPERISETKVRWTKDEAKWTKEEADRCEDLADYPSERENSVQNAPDKIAGKVCLSNSLDSKPPGLMRVLPGSGAQSVLRTTAECDIGGLTVDWKSARADLEEDPDWRMLPGKSWREDQRKEQEVMVQNLVRNPTKICVDSGAGESVCPEGAFPDFETHQTDKVGNLYRAAGGQELRNVGEKRPRFKINGIQTSMTFQATTHVKKPLAAASRITSKGNRIILDDADSSSYIENKATGTRIPLKIENGIYVMEVAVESKKKEAPFQRQAK